MTLIEVWAWAWIYLGMAVGLLTVLIVLASIIHDHNNKDKK